MSEPTKQVPVTRGELYRMSAWVRVPTHQLDDRKHTHGMDCCWPCYEGRPVHPEEDDDPACVERADKTGRCGYRREATA